MAKSQISLSKSFVNVVVNELSEIYAYLPASTDYRYRMRLANIITILQEKNCSLREGHSC